jgi:hypothetical protein
VFPAGKAQVLFQPVVVAEYAFTLLQGAVFGQIKDARGFERYMRRGLSACRSEWTLICATHNLLKLWRSGNAAWN